MRIGVCGRYRIHRSALAETLAQEPDVDLVVAKRSVDNLRRACAEGELDAVVVLPRPGDAGLVTEAVGSFGAAHVVCVGHPTSPQENDGPTVISLDLSTSVGQLLRVLRSVAALPPRVAILTPSATGRPSAGAALSDREVQILRLLSQGLTAEEAARETGLSPKTVDNHRRRIYAKLGVQTQTHAVARAVGEGLLAAGSPRRTKGRAD